MPEGAQLETAALRLSSSYRRLAGMAGAASDEAEQRRDHPRNADSLTIWPWS